MAAAYLPNLMSQARISNGVVQPLYPAAPAPMGIGDFGVRNTTGTAQGYILRSTSWQAVLSLNDTSALYLDDGSPDYFGIQLNTVMTNTTVAGNTSYSYWIQNVVFYSSATQQLRFIDNIWNFSNPSTNEPASTFYQYNGTPVAPTFYYDVYPSFNLPALNVPFPFTIHLYENSSLTEDPTTHDVWSTVRFGYDIVNGTGVALYQGVYDTVLFNSSVTATDNPPVPEFTVDGTAFNPVGLLDDAEVMIGGPGGGSTTTVYAINGTERLQYLNLSTMQYTNDPSAWDLGTDTGETVEGISETYNVPGTVQLSPGPSLLMPFWNATPGGNIGDAAIEGTVTPSNAFLFFNQGSTFNAEQAAWAPVPADGEYEYHLPPGTYFALAEASAYDPATSTGTLAVGSTTVNWPLVADPPVGIYTPLWAWDNHQLANLSTAGSGTATDPYILMNNEPFELDPLYGQMNDFFFPVFAGIFLSGTSAYVDINQPPAFTVQYLAFQEAMNSRFGFPNTNELGIQANDASHVSIWQGSFTGWFTGFASSIPPFAPIANVAFWNVTNSLVGDSAFLDQGSALLLAMGGNNVVWGNTFSPGPQFPAAYEYPYELGIQEFESGDLIFNNLANTNLPAIGFNENLYTGAAQTVQDDWNLSAPEAATKTMTVNGYTLTGSIVGSPWQCGNSWSTYAPGSPLPFDDFGLIMTGGDYCPYPLQTYAVTFTETGLSSGGWGVALDGMVLTAAAGSPVVFHAPNGAFAYAIGAVPGRTVTPATGNVTVAGAGVQVAITIAGAFAASLNASPTATDTGQDISFSATVSGGSGTYTYAWAFGDGVTSTSAAPTHAYTSAGTFTVTLWANDTAGGSLKRQTSLTINPAPSVSATVSKTATDVGMSLAFTATPSGGTGTSTVSWDFGDGSAATGTSATHAYSAAGSYTVHVTVTDAVGVTVSATAAVTVAAAPAASATASTTTPTTGTNVSFTGSSTGGTSPVTYAWSFGDGSTSSAQSPSHTYSTAGVYTVTLWANDSVGGSSHTTLTVVVSAPPANVVDSGTATLYTVAALVAGLVVGAVVGLLIGRRKKQGNPPG